MSDLKESLGRRVQKDLDSKRRPMSITVRFDYDNWAWLKSKGKRKMSEEIVKSVTKARFLEGDDS